MEFMIPSRKPDSYTILCSVRVGSLGVDALVVLDVHEGFVHYASEASMVTLLYQ